MKLLNAAAAIKAKLCKDLDRKQVSVVTGIKASSTIRNAVAKLKKDGLVEVTKEAIIITDKGMEEADASAMDLFNTTKSTTTASRSNSN